MNDQDLRIGDAEREQAAAELGEHYAQGRLTTDEHRERLDQIWAARTRRQLGPVFADLPGRTFPPPAAVRSMTPPRTVPGRALWRRIPFPLLVLLVVLAAIVVVAHLPLVLVGIGAWLLLSRGACGGRTHHRP